MNVDRHQGKKVNLWLTQEQYEQLVEYAATYRVPISVTAVVRQAIVEFLEKDDDQ